MFSGCLPILPVLMNVITQHHPDGNPFIQSIQRLQETLSLLANTLNRIVFVVVLMTLMIVTVM